MAKLTRARFIAETLQGYGVTTVFFMPARPAIIDSIAPAAWRP